MTTTRQIVSQASFWQYSEVCLSTSRLVAEAVADYSKDYRLSARCKVIHAEPVKDYNVIRLLHHVSFDQRIWRAQRDCLVSLVQRLTLAVWQSTARFACLIKSVDNRFLTECSKTLTG